MLCSNDDLPNGCKTPDKCIAKQKDDAGMICEQQQCPFNCTDKQHLCVGDVDTNGCKKEDTCVARQVTETGGLCPGTCPVECKNNEILCVGQICEACVIKGCKGQDVCHPKVKDYGGVFCPSDSASHECPKTCPDNEVLCPPFEGPDGCKGPYTCKPKSKDNNNASCPITSDCPVYCKPNEHNCPKGFGEDGCKLPDECLEKERDFEGDLCPLRCPEVCGDGQIFCDGHIDEKGCKGPSSCITPEDHKWGPGAEVEPKDKCPGYCPVKCENHEILCPSQVDYCNGCPTGELCREAIKAKNTLFCPGKEEQGKDSKDTKLRRGGYLSYSHGCTKLCNEKEGEVLCPVYEEDNGCKPEAPCVKRVKNNDGGWCSSHSVCQKQCPKHTLLCEYEDLDSNGCKVESICKPRGTKTSGLFCTGFCPPICPSGWILTKGGIADDGCQIAPYCIETTTATPLQAV